MTSTQINPEKKLDLTGEVLISADSHVMEPPNLWKDHLPAGLQDRAPVFPPRPAVGTGMADHRPGGYDPTERVKEMETDGVSAEVLYPTLGLRIFGIDDPEIQEASFTVYNDWLIDYCNVAPGRLVGIPCLSCFNIDQAVSELERTNKAGLVGGLIWQVPHPNLPFSSEHYEPLWSKAEEMGVPIHLHILTGFDYSAMSRDGDRKDPVEGHRGSVNHKLNSITNSLFDLIFTGVLERHPKLNIVIVESEIGWIPFTLQQWDYYYNRFIKERPVPITMPPSEYFNRQIYATFFNDAVGGQLLSWWGQDNCMWSTDYPHPNSPWPNSRDVLATNLGHLPMDTVRKLTRTTVEKLYPVTGS